MCVCVCALHILTRRVKGRIPYAHAEVSRCVCECVWMPLYKINIYHTKCIRNAYEALKRLYRHRMIMMYVCVLAVCTQTSRSIILSMPFTRSHYIPFHFFLSLSVSVFVNVCMCVYNEQCTTTVRLSLSCVCICVCMYKWVYFSAFTWCYAFQNCEYYFRSYIRNVRYNESGSFLQFSLARSVYISSTENIEQNK